MKIVTHAGQCHADDLMAVALICIKERVDPRSIEILRINDGKAEDFPDADFIVDVGKQYDPEKKWFDHHQFPKDHAPECAFTLVAAHYGIGRNDLNWIERLAYLDSKGPWEFYKNQLGRKARNRKEIDNFLGTCDVFSWFCRIANTTYKDPDAFVVGLELAIRWLKSELDYIPNRKDNFKYAMSNLKIVDMGSFKIAHFNQKESKGINDVCDDISSKDPTIIIQSCPDNRGSGFAAWRLNDCRRVDFSPLKGETGCVFAHVQGFCVKWENNWDGFLDAIKKSVSTEVAA